MEKENVKNQLFGTLIHSCRFKRQRPVLGQYSIGRVGQYSISANNLDYDIEDRSDPNAEGLARLVGRLSRVNERWEPVPFIGEIRFYRYVSETDNAEFSAYFVNGMLNFLTPIGKEPISVKTQVQLRSGREAQVEPAKGIHGMLLVSGAGDGYFLRVRHGTEFLDYRLAHSDVKIRIVDNDAFFYRAGDDLWLDHAPKTLGLEIVNVKEGT